jgi:hypothetical protein
VIARDGSDHQLSWHREYRPGPRKRVVIAVKAWVPLLNPDATMPPYYRITMVAYRSPARVVRLHNCIACGGGRLEVCVESNLASAKAAAQADYDKRLA